MPQTHRPIVRYQIIDQCLRSEIDRYPSMEELIRAICDKDIPASVSTVQKDIKYMKGKPPLGFGAPIGYSRREGGYYYKDPSFSIQRIPLSDTELESLRDAVETVRQLAGGRMHTTFQAAINKVLLSVDPDAGANERSDTLVQYEGTGSDVETAHLDLLLGLLRREQPLSLVYYSRENRKFSAHLVHPYMIKEFHNRWHLVGYSEQAREVLTFKLEYVFDPHRVKAVFQPIAIGLLEKFSDFYGVFPLKGMKKQRILFRADPYRADEIRNHPIHSSQREVKSDQSGRDGFRLDLVPTEELVEWLLSAGNSVELKEPAALIEVLMKRRGA